MRKRQSPDLFSISHYTFGTYHITCQLTWETRDHTCQACCWRLGSHNARRFSRQWSPKEKGHKKWWRHVCTGCLIKSPTHPSQLSFGTNHSQIFPSSFIVIGVLYNSTFHPMAFLTTNCLTGVSMLREISQRDYDSTHSIETLHSTSEITCTYCWVHPSP